MGATRSCARCNEVLSVESIVCSNCGIVQPGEAPEVTKPIEPEVTLPQVRHPAKKEKFIAILLAFLIGPFGVHKFYLDENRAGVLYLCFFWTFVPTILTYLDIFRLLLMSDEDFDNRYNSALKIAK